MVSTFPCPSSLFIPRKSMVVTNTVVVPLNATSFHPALAIFRSRIARAMSWAASQLAPSLALMNIAVLALIALLTLARQTTFPRLSRTLALTLTHMLMTTILPPTCARHKVMSLPFARCIHPSLVAYNFYHAL